MSAKPATPFHPHDPATYEPLDAELDAEERSDAEREAQLADECYYGEDDDAL